MILNVTSSDNDSSRSISFHTGKMLQEPNTPTTLNLSLSAEAGSCSHTDQINCTAQSSYAMAAGVLDCSSSALFPSRLILENFIRKPGKP